MTGDLGFILAYPTRASRPALSSRKVACARAYFFPDVSLPPAAPPAVCAQVARPLSRTMRRQLLPLCPARPPSLPRVATATLAATSHTSDTHSAGEMKSALEADQTGGRTVRDRHARADSPNGEPAPASARLECRSTATPWRDDTTATVCGGTNPQIAARGGGWLASGSQRPPYGHSVCHSAHRIVKSHGSSGESAAQAVLEVS